MSGHYIPKFLLFLHFYNHAFQRGSYCHKKNVAEIFFPVCAKEKKLHNPYIYAGVFSLLHPHIYRSLSSISLTHLRFRSSTPHGNVLYRNFANFYSYTRYPIILSLLEYNV